MFVIGFATADEIAILKREEWEVEDATRFSKVVDRVDGSLMLPPEPSPSNTQAVAIFVDASVFDVLRPRNLMAGDSHLDLEYKTKRLNAPEQHPPAIGEASAAPVCTCGVAKHGYKNHEGFCAVSLRDRGLPWQPLSTIEWEIENTRLREEEEQLLAEIRRKRDNHKFRCTHKHPDGTDLRAACGGGETFCYTCRQQFD